jgi:hypothetical protein
VQRHSTNRHALGIVGDIGAHAEEPFMKSQSTLELVHTLVNRVGAAVAVAAIVIRFAAGHASVAGHLGAWWAGVLMLAVVVSRLVWGALEVAARRLPWTRLLLPALIAIELALYVVGRTSRGAMIKVLVPVELALVITTVVAVFVRRSATSAEGYWEDRVERALTRFVPAALARLLAIELAIVSSAVAAPFRRKLRLQPNEFSYFEGSPLRWLPFLLLLAMPADLLLVHVLVPARFALARWILTGSGVYALLWVVGVGVTMRRRPHRVGSETVEVYRGVLRRAHWPARAIEEVAIRQPVSSVRELRGRGSAAWLASSRMPLVEVSLSEPARVRRAIGPDGPPTTRLLIAVDQPEPFRLALLQAAERQRSRA